MYQQAVTTPDQAVAHLFFHCCFRDEIATQTETASIADKLVATGVNKDLNLKEEVMAYKAYQPHLSDEPAYVHYLINLLQPVNTFALFSYCVELCLTDLVLHPEEDHLLNTIAQALNINHSEKGVILQLIKERKVIESKKIF